MSEVDGTLGDALIPAINKLHDVFASASLDLRVDLPQVAVVGAQSAGKSSVLEALVGRDFLPRGAGICTRRPLLLQLVRVPSASSSSSSSSSSSPCNSKNNSNSSKEAKGGGGQEEEEEEWAEFLHLPGRRFFDFSRVRDEISAETERGAGSGQAISDAPIRLKICSPHVLTMTLVDLPGLAKLPVGDQPPDVERRVRELALKYITAPTCVILAVTPAGADAATSDALHLAREADPRGERTLGVLTKCDLVDFSCGGGSGGGGSSSSISSSCGGGSEMMMTTTTTSSVASLLRGELLPMRLGYIAIVCRGERASRSGATAADGRVAEAAFFASERGAELVAAAAASSPSSRDKGARGSSSSISLLASRCGVPALAATLNRVLTDAVRGALPELRRALEEALRERSTELAALGGGGGAFSSPLSSTSTMSELDLISGIGSLLSSSSSTSSSSHSSSATAAAAAAASLHPSDASPAATAARGGLLLQLLESYTSAFAGALDGSSPALPLTQLAGGARLRHVFRDVFVRSLDALDPCSELSDDDVRTAVRNAGGVRGTLLIPDAPFELLARRAIARLLPPALHCKELAVAELLRLADECTPPQVRRFPALRSALLSAVDEFVAAGAVPAERMIRDLVSCELAFINTDHPDFVGGSRAVAMAMERRQQLQQEQEESNNGAVTPTPAAAQQQQQQQQHQSKNAPAAAATAAPRNHHHHLTTVGLASALRSPSPAASSFAADARTGAGRKGGGDNAAAAAASSTATTALQETPPARMTSMGRGGHHASSSVFASEDEAWNASVAAATTTASSSSSSSPAAVAASSGGGWRFVGGWLGGGGGGGSNNAAAATTTPTPSPSPVPQNEKHSSYYYYYQQQQSAHGYYSSSSSSSSLNAPPATLTVADGTSSSSMPPLSPSSEAEEVQVEVTRTLVRCYFSIVARGLADAVPKAVMHFLVRSAARGLQQHLITRLYKEELFAELVAEAPGVARRREAAARAVRAAREGLASLDALPAALAAASRAGCGGGGGGGTRSGTSGLRSSRDDGMPPPTSSTAISVGAGRKAVSSSSSYSSSSRGKTSAAAPTTTTSRVGALAAAARLATAALGDRAGL